MRGKESERRWVHGWHQLTIIDTDGPVWNKTQQFRDTSCRQAAAVPHYQGQLTSSRQWSHIFLCEKNALENTTPISLACRDLLVFIALFLTYYIAVSFLHVTYLVFCVCSTGNYT